MFRFIRYRCIIFRHIIFWLFIIIMMKLTIIIYYDLQQQSIDSSSLALPFDDSKLNKEKKQTLLNLTTYQFQSINTTIIINRTTIEYYRQYVQRKNHEQLMYNDYLFSSNTTRYILLVQVHTRVVYLKKFIEMLKAVQTINQTLLIFSHDFIDPQINILITNIKFVPLNFVFHSINVLQNRSDLLVLLLEEDFYLSPDALYFLKKMEDEKQRLCPECLIYTLGNLEKTGRQFNNLGSKVSIAYWHARYNLGMTISYSLWLSIVQYAEEFCNVDDYNWDWSLVYLAQKRFNYPRVMWSSSARVIHLGSCGTHHKKTCSNQSDIARWEETDKFYQLNRKYLFPTNPLTVHAKYEARRPLKQTNGGWSDLRDRQLCLSFALKNPKDISHINIKN
ncbi:unnamed protein product [Rotaria sp. Silwood1]|nr:unnamed protein product [Rotaria sp. Silwood1]